MPRFRQIKQDGMWILVDANTYQEPEKRRFRILAKLG